jgi:hypothetical protein
MSEPVEGTFIWIPKTGGSSIRHKLSEYGMVSDKYSMKRCAPLMTFGHQTPVDAMGFTFCIVRNPYDRAVSLYWHYRKRKRYRHSFLHFLQTLQRGIDPVGRWNVSGMSQANPQVAWMQSGIDYVGRFENIQGSYDVICQRLGVPCADMPHKNDGKHAAWQTFYRPEAARLVEHIYHDDFVEFGYEKGLMQ